MNVKKIIICMLVLVVCIHSLSAITDAQLEANYFTPSDDLFDGAVRKLSNSADFSKHADFIAALEKAKEHRYSMSQKTTSLTAATKPLFDAMANLTDEQRKDPKVAAAVARAKEALEKKYIAPDLIEFEEGTPLANLKSGSKIATSWVSVAVAKSPRDDRFEVAHPLGSKGDLVPKPGFLTRVTRGLWRGPREDAKIALSAAPETSSAAEALQIYNNAKARRNERGDAKLGFLRFRQDTTNRRAVSKLEHEAQLLESQKQELVRIHSRMADTNPNKQSVAVLVDDLHKSHKNLRASQHRAYNRLNSTRARERIAKATAGRQQRVATK